MYISVAYLADVKLDDSSLQTYSWLTLPNTANRVQGARLNKLQMIFCIVSCCRCCAALDMYAGLEVFVMLQTYPCLGYLKSNLPRLV